MGYRMTAMTCIALSLVAARAHASDDVLIETFDARTIGATDLNIDNHAFLFKTLLSGGAVMAGTAANPAHSASNVYGGTTITLVTEDEDQFSWPGVGAWVSGRETITLKAYGYDVNTGMDELLGSKSVRSGTNRYLSLGTFRFPLQISKATFSSNGAFTLDDLTLGIEGISPGLPEPASWAMMVGGLGMVGGMLRSRQRMGTLSIRCG